MAEKAVFPVSAEVGLKESPAFATVFEGLVSSVRFDGYLRQLVLTVCILAAVSEVAAVSVQPVVTKSRSPVSVLVGYLFLREFNHGLILMRSPIAKSRHREIGIRHEFLASKTQKVPSDPSRFACHCLVLM